MTQFDFEGALEALHNLNEDLGFINPDSHYGKHCRTTALALKLAERLQSGELFEFKNESKAFEEFAINNRLDMSQHPLHYLFLDRTTGRARSSWKACLGYIKKTMSEQLIKEVCDEV